MGSADRLEIAFPRRHFVAGAVLSAAGLVLSAWLARQVGGPAAAALPVLCAAWCAGAVLGIGGAVALPPVWRIGPDGIAVLGIGLIRWDRIAAVRPLRRGTALHIVLAGPALPGGGPLRRLGLSLRGVPGLSPLRLGLTGLGTGAADIRAAVERHAPGRWGAQLRPGT